MAQRNTFAHFLHDAGLAVWFGGTLAGAVAVNGAAADVDDPRQRARVANAGWARWTPVNAAAIGAHLLGGAQIARANRGRIKHQQGVLANTNTKLALTAAALGATAYARVLGKKVEAATDPTSTVTPEEAATAQKQLAGLQWAIPALTGGILVSSALHEEQATPREVVRGTVKALPDTLGQAAASAAAATAAVVVPALGQARAAVVPVAKDAGEKLAEAAKDAKDTLTPLARDARDAAVPLAKDARNAVAPYARDAYDTISPKVIDLRDAVAPRLRDARDVAVPYARDAYDAVSPRVRDAYVVVSPKVRDAYVVAAPKVRGALDTAGPKLRDAKVAAVVAVSPYAQEARVQLVDVGHAVGKQARTRYGKARKPRPTS